MVPLVYKYQQMYLCHHQGGERNLRVVDRITEKTSHIEMMNLLVEMEKIKSLKRMKIYRAQFTKIFLHWGILYLSPI